MISAISFAGRPLTCALCILLLSVATYADDPGTFYKRSNLPRFKSKSLREGDTHIVLDKLDLKNNSFSATCLRDREILYRFEFSYTSPPRELRIDEQFDLVCGMRRYEAPSEPDPLEKSAVQIILMPEPQFRMDGYPLTKNPLSFSFGELASVSDRKNREDPVTQRLRLTLVSADASTITCGYEVLLGWGVDLREVRIEFSYSRKKGWWKRAASNADIAMDDKNSSTMDNRRPALPGDPWRDEKLQRYFAAYIADLNVTLREKQGPAWVVDAWGRELSPHLVVPIKPDGTWEGPNHYLWGMNVKHDFYPLTIRAYILRRFEAEEVMPRPVDSTKP